MNRLDPGEPPGQALAGLHLVTGVGERARLEVGVPARLVGVGVVAVVLVEPPGEAESGAQVGEHHADDVVALPVATDLAVAGVVGDEAELAQGEGHAEGHDDGPPAAGQQDPDGAEDDEGAPRWR